MVSSQTDKRGRILVDFESVKQHCGLAFEERFAEQQRHADDESVTVETVTHTADPNAVAMEQAVALLKQAHGHLEHVMDLALKDREGQYGALRDELKRLRADNASLHTRILKYMETEEDALSKETERQLMVFDWENRQVQRTELIRFVSTMFGKSLGDEKVTKIADYVASLVTAGGEAPPAPPAHPPATPSE